MHSARNRKFHVSAFLFFFITNSSFANTGTEPSSLFGNLFSTPVNLAYALINRASTLIHSHPKFLGLTQDHEFKQGEAVSDEISTTVRFPQKYRGVDVVGAEALFHYDHEGNLKAVTGGAVSTSVSPFPTVTLNEAKRILNTHYGQTVSYSEPAQLKILPEFNGSSRLVYLLKTASTETHRGKEIYLDAHRGEILMELDRVCEITAHPEENALRDRALFFAQKSLNNPEVINENIIKNTVMTADTEDGLKYRTSTGFPTRIGLSLYDKVAEEATRKASADFPAMRAYLNTVAVYQYYKKVHNRESYDNKNSRIVSVVHMGPAINAFWTSELKFIAYGDGDGSFFKDFTLGLDVTAHELTHAVVSNHADLIYSGESGALNESYADFFGRMIDFSDDHWDIGRDVMGPDSGMRAIRNMEHPEEFNQPSHNEHPYRTATTGNCNRFNDFCGVHRNSGIPNRAAVLIVQGFTKLHPEQYGLGKTMAEKLYYNVLTQRLRSNSDFKDMRLKTEEACAEFYGPASAECKVVSDAFDDVRIPKST